LFLLLVLSTSFISGEIPERSISIGLVQAVDMSIANDKALQIQDNELLKSESLHLEARSLLRPQVDLSVNWLYNADYPQMATTRFYTDFNVLTKVSASQIITTFGKLDAIVSSSKHKVKISTYEKDALEDNIVYTTKVTYNNLVLADRLSKIRRSSYENALKNKSILEDRSANGRVSKNDNIKIESDVFARVSPMKVASSRYLQTLDSLKNQIGVSLDTDLVLEEEYKSVHYILDENLMIIKMKQYHPVIKALEEVILLSQQLVKAKKAEYYPNISAHASWQNKGGSNDYYVGRRNLENYSEVALSLSLPLYNGGKRKEQLSQAKVDEDISIIRLRKIEEDLQLDLTTSITKYNHLLQTFSSNDRAVEFAEKAFKFSQELFETGQISVTDLNDAEFRLTNQRLKQELDFFELYNVAAKIESLVGDIVL